MKFKCSYKPGEKILDRWFAWYPVTCTDDDLCHWLEFVNRRRTRIAHFPDLTWETSYWTIPVVWD